MQRIIVITLALCACILISTPSHAGVKAKAILEMLRKPNIQQPSISRAYRRAYMYEVGIGTSAAKRVLSARLSYRKELQEVGRLHQRIQHTSLLSTNFQLLRHDIAKTIINKTLRASLLEHLKHGNPASLLNELENYYHLAPNYIPTYHVTMEASESFARNALAYLRRHPHKPNWPLRHILRTEGIDPAIKEEIRGIINRGYVPSDQADHFLKLLQAAYEQYQRLLEASIQDENVKATVAIYKYLADELQAFVAANKRAPRFGKENEAEHDLFNLILVLAYNHRSNHFEQAIPHIFRLYELLEMFPSPRLEEQATLKELTKFIKEYNDVPQSVHMRDLLQPRRNEDILYESILYWQRNSPAFLEEFSMILLRHKTKTKYIPPPFNYY